MRSAVLLVTVAFLSVHPVSAAGPIRSAAALADYMDRTPDKSISFELTGTVLITGSTVHTNLTCSIVLEDGTGRVGLSNADPKTPVPGDVIHATGDGKIEENGEPFVCIRNLETVGKASLPEIVDVPLRKLSADSHAYRLVRTEGTLIEVVQDEFDGRSAFLLLKDEDTIIPVYMPSQAAPRAMSYVGSRLRVSGYYYTRIDGIRRYSGPFIALQGDYEVVRPAPEDPFDVLAVDFRRNQSPHDISRLEKRRVNGRVLAVWSENQAIVRTSDKHILNIEFAVGIPLPEPDSNVCIVGYPQTDLFRIKLVKAYWRPSSADVPPVSTAAFDTTIRRLARIARPCLNIQDLCHGRPVRLEGLVQNVRPSSSEADGEFNVASEDFSIRVICPRALGPVTPQVGAVVRVTGICCRPSETWQPYLTLPHIYDCQIILRRPSDVTTIARPHWLTPKRVFVILGLLGLVILGILLRNRHLNRLIARRGRELAREQLSHLASELKTGERTRLAVELHDTLSQNLAGLACILGTSESALPTDPRLAQRGLATANRMLQSCRTELRHCLFDLRNDMLDEHDFPTAIRKTLAQLEPEAEISIRFAVSRSRFHDATVHAILSIIRELVSNALRHGKATSVRIAGSVENGTLLFSVTDNGTGFDPAACPGPDEGHFGIDGIRERLSRRNGRLSYESRPGQTYARIEIPLPRENAAEDETT